MGAEVRKGDRTLWKRHSCREMAKVLLAGWGRMFGEMMMIMMMIMIMIPIINDNSQLL